MLLCELSVLCRSCAFSQGHFIQFFSNTFQSKAPLTSTVKASQSLAHLKDSKLFSLRSSQRGSAWKQRFVDQRGQRGAARLVLTTAGFWSPCRGAFRCFSSNVHQRLPPERRQTWLQVKAAAAQRLSENIKWRPTFNKELWSEWLISLLLCLWHFLNEPYH